MIEKKTWSRRPDIYDWDKLMQYSGNNRAYKYFEGNIWLFTHNLGSLSLIADAWVTEETKNDGIELINITILDINTVKFEFTGNAKGYGTVLSIIDQQGSGRVLEQETLAQYWELDHNLNTVGTVSDIWVDDPLVRVIDYSTDHDKVYVTFDRPAKGAVIMALVDNSVAQDLSIHWTQIGGKPVEYNPTAHTHQGVDIESAVEDSNHLGTQPPNYYLNITQIGTDIPPLDSTQKIPLSFLPPSMQINVGTTEKDYIGNYITTYNVPTLRFSHTLFNTFLNAQGDFEVSMPEYIHSIQITGNVPPAMAADVRPDPNSNRIQFKAGNGIGMKCDPSIPSQLELYTLDTQSIFWKFNRQLQPNEFWEISSPEFSLDVSKSLFNVYAYVPKGTDSHIWNPQVQINTLSTYFDVLDSSKPIDELLEVQNGVIKFKVFGYYGYTLKSDIDSPLSLSIPSSTSTVLDLYIHKYIESETTDPITGEITITYGYTTYILAKNSLHNLQILSYNPDEIDNTILAGVLDAYIEYPNIKYIKKDILTNNIQVFEYNIITKTNTFLYTFTASLLGLLSSSQVYYYREYEIEGTRYAFIGEKQRSSVYRVPIAALPQVEIYDIPTQYSIAQAKYIRLSDGKWAVISNNSLVGIGDLEALEYILPSNTTLESNCVGIYSPSYDNTYFLCSDGTLYHFVWDGNVQIIYEKGHALIRAKNTEHSTYKIPKFFDTVYSPRWLGNELGIVKLGVFDVQHPDTLHVYNEGNVEYINPSELHLKGTNRNVEAIPIMFNGNKILGSAIYIESNDSAECPEVDLSMFFMGVFGERYINNPSEIEMSIFNTYCVLYNKSDKPIGPILVVKK